MKNILIYTKNNCPYCVRAKNYLKSNNFENEIQEINVEENPLKREEFEARSNGRKTFPQIFIKEKHIGGCDDLMKFSKEEIASMLK